MSERTRHSRLVAAGVVLELAAVACGHKAAKPAPANPALGVRTKTADCHVQGGYPDRACTPGAVFAGITAAKICVQGYSSGVRDVPEFEKKAVYKEYGIASHRPYAYEVDHLVSLELGGSNSISNLWPEAASPLPGYHQKDRVENYLHQQVCAHQITLQTAQVEISTEWLQIYQQIKDK